MQEVTGDRPAVVVMHRGESRLLRFALPVVEQDVEVFVVGLPNVVGPLGLVAVEVELLGVGHRSLVGELGERRLHPADHAAHLTVEWSRPAIRGGDLRGPALDGGHRGSRGHERQPLDRRHKIFGEFVAVAAIARGFLSRPGSPSRLQDAIQLCAVLSGTAYAAAARARGTPSFTAGRRTRNRASASSPCWSACPLRFNRAQRSTKTGRKLFGSRPRLVR